MAGNATTTDAMYANMKDARTVETVGRNRPGKITIVGSKLTSNHTEFIRDSGWYISEVKPAQSKSSPKVITIIERDLAV